MNEEPKKKSTASPAQRGESAGQKSNQGVSGFVGRKNESRAQDSGKKPVHISQEEAQSIPADRDPDDPVSR